MTRQYSHRNRTQVARAILEMDSYWADAFADVGVGDLNYCDLFTEMWLRGSEPLRKTDLYQFMPNISQRTAVKYVQFAIDAGLLVERPSDQDKRVRHIGLAPAMVARLERFLDYTFERFRSIGS